MVRLHPIRLIRKKVGRIRRILEWRSKRNLVDVRERISGMKSAYHSGEHFLSPLVEEKKRAIREAYGSMGKTAELETRGRGSPSLNNGDEDKDGEEENPEWTDVTPKKKLGEKWFRKSFNLPDDAELFMENPPEFVIDIDTDGPSYDYETGKYVVRYRKAGPSLGDEQPKGRSPVIRIKSALARISLSPDLVDSGIVIDTIYLMEGKVSPESFTKLVEYARIMDEAIVKRDYSTIEEASHRIEEILDGTMPVTLGPALPDVERDESGSVPALGEVPPFDQWVKSMSEVTGVPIEQVRTGQAAHQYATAMGWVKKNPVSSLSNIVAYEQTPADIRQIEVGVFTDENPNAVVEKDGVRYVKRTFDKKRDAVNYFDRVRYAGDETVVPQKAHIKIPPSRLKKDNCKWVITYAYVPLIPTVVKELEEERPSRMVPA